MSWSSQNLPLSLASIESFAAGIAFAVRIGEAADAANHHPDLTITYPSVAVSITTHDAGGLTDLDVDLARTISAIARDLDVAVVPDRGDP